MSTSYKSFAQVYDQFMDNIPYNEWCRYILSLLKEYSIDNGTIVELGCGTGTICQQLSNTYFMIGIDNSKEMLSIAREKLKNSKNICLLEQNMCNLYLPNDTTYDAFISVCDSINYLLYDEELIETFENIKQYLRPNGIFLFDLKTIYFYSQILGDQVFCDHQDDCSYTWENNYFEEYQINQYELTIFIRDKESNLYQKFCETHHQRGYELTKVIDFLTMAGLEYVASYEAFTHKEVSPTSERIYIIARNGD